MHMYEFKEKYQIMSNFQTSCWGCYGGGGGWVAQHVKYSSLIDIVFPIMLYTHYQSPSFAVEI